MKKFKLFAEYLLEKQLLTEDQLLQILKEQLLALPSISEIIIDKKLLKASDVLKVFALQSQESMDFADACKKLNIWSENIQVQINNEIRSKRISIGKFILEKEILTFENLNLALEDYLHSNTQEIKTEPCEIPQIVDIKHLSVSSRVDAKDPLVANYQELLTEENKTQLQNYFENWKSGNNGASANHEALGLAKRLQGAAQLAGLESLSQLFAILAQPLDSDADVQRKQNLFEDLQSAVQKIWDLHKESDQATLANELNSIISRLKK